MAMSVLYIQGNGRLAGEIRGGVWTSYVGDSLGSCIATTDSSGTITSTADYWPNGELASSTGTNPSPWGFCGLLGYFTDLASRLYVRARHLTTALARWLTVDPIWPKAPAYRYALRPTMQVDPLGLFGQLVLVGAGAAEAGTVLGVEVSVPVVGWIAAAATAVVLLGIVVYNYASRAPDTSKPSNAITALAANTELWMNCYEEQYYACMAILGDPIECCNQAIDYCDKRYPLEPPSTTPPLDIPPRDLGPGRIFQRPGHSPIQT